MTDIPRMLFGLQVQSELPLPDLPWAQGEGPRVEVVFGRVAEPEDMVAAGEESLTIRIRDVGRYRIERGERIVIDPAPGAEERELRVFLLGSAFGALLHQLGLLPLHANTVEVDGHAIAFFGPSGAGKSTLAHWFERQGHAVLADDVSAIEPRSCSVMSAVPRLRLWKDALEHSGADASLFSRSFVGQDKFDVPVRRRASGPRRLAACIELGRSDDFSFERLTGAEAATALVANTYRGKFVPLMGRSKSHFGNCLDVASRVPVYRAGRRWDHSHFNADAWRLHACARNLVQAISGFQAEHGLA